MVTSARRVSAKDLIAKIISRWEDKPSISQILCVIGMYFHTVLTDYFKRTESIYAISICQSYYDLHQVNKKP
ncbi:hypothetical protein SOASR014_10590 [Pectobacterium carotovorum subsp. carotovorum]|nr:hypothetical protein SOASR014_10590 [Pectobacterium carotovorum subsp. carotovorum]